jgi:predicted nucleic acid-binding Zn ribbon protein
LQKTSDDPLEYCPDCGKHALVKQVSAAGFRLKGSGWYETDFKKGAKKNLAGDKPPASESKKVKAGDASKK